jgi:hypothetical protein
MEWKCFTCEHLNGPNLSECEVCGTIRNLYAEEAFEHKEAIKKLETQVKTLKGSLTKTRSERDQLINQISEKSYEVESLASVSDSKNIELNILKGKEITLLQSIKNKDAQINEINKKVTLLTKAITDRDGKIIDKDSKIRTKDAKIANLQTEVKSLTSQLNEKKNSYFLIWFFITICLGLSSYIYYKQVYLPNLKADYISQINKAFKEFSNSTLETWCSNEDIGARTTLADDLNNDGELDGIIIATFNGTDCKNNFATILYVYNIKTGFGNPPLSYPLSKANESYLSFRGVENGKLVFDKWNMKDYNQKKYDSEKIKNSHTRIYISIQNDSLISTTL